MIWTTVLEKRYHSQVIDGAPLSRRHIDTDRHRHRQTYTHGHTHMAFTDARILRRIDAYIHRHIHTRKHTDPHIRAAHNVAHYSFFSCYMLHDLTHNLFPHRHTDRQTETDRVDRQAESDKDRRRQT